MEFSRLSIEGLILVESPPKHDSRGSFSKTFHETSFSRAGCPALIFREEFYSHSVSGVIRGLHFQVPPNQHAKMVYCVAGRVIDVVVDLRKSSPTFQKTYAVELSPENGWALILPEGMAHGFLALEECTMMYKVTSEHDPACDAGIRWDSIGYEWPIEDPILSERDQNFPTLQSFRSPF